MIAICVWISMVLYLLCQCMIKSHYYWFFLSESLCPFFLCINYYKLHFDAIFISLSIVFTCRNSLSCTVEPHLSDVLLTHSLHYLALRQDCSLWYSPFTVLHWPVQNAEHYRILHFDRYWIEVLNPIKCHIIVYHQPYQLTPSNNLIVVKIPLSPRFINCCIM